VQYWPGTSKSGFIDTILLEDPETGGTLKISVLPEPPPVNDLDIEELDTNSPKTGAKRRPSKDDSAKSASGSDELSNQPKSTEANPGNTILNTEEISHTSTSGSTTSNTQGSTHTNNSDNNTSITTKDSETDHSVNIPSELREGGAKKPKLDVSGDHGGYDGYREYTLGPHIEYSKLIVEDDKGDSHQLWHIRCSGWKDQEAPDLDMFMDLWNLVQEKLKTYKPDGGEKVKLVIHCTGGVGRTGTFIAIDLAGQELKDKKTNGKWENFSIEKVISFLRKKRMNMVGSASQYVFCHRAALNMFGNPPPT